MAYAPMFEMWRTVQGGVPYDVVLDLGRGEDYPLVSHPWFFGVRIPMADREEDGAPPPTESARLDVVENRIREQVRNRDGMYVGRRTGGGNRDLAFYLPRKPLGIEERIRSSIGTELLFISRSDRKWEGYEQLLPTPRELRQIEDARALAELIFAGNDPEAPHTVGHRVSTSSKKGAMALAKLFAKLELNDVRVSGGRPEYMVFGSQLTLLDLEPIHRVSWILESKAPKARGVYLGWQAEPAAHVELEPDEDAALGALLHALAASRESEQEDAE